MTPQQLRQEFYSQNAKLEKLNPELAKVFRDTFEMAEDLKVLLSEHVFLDEQDN